MGAGMGPEPNSIFLHFIDLIPVHRDKITFCLVRHIHLERFHEITENNILLAIADLCAEIEYFQLGLVPAYKIIHIKVTFLIAQ